MLGRLSLNPMRHIDAVGTLLVPGVLLAVGGPLFGWARPVPVATSALRHPRRAMVCVALAGPAANLVMAALWCGVLAVSVRFGGSGIVAGWITLMAQAGMWFNVVLAVFNLLPVPPLDGGRVLAGLLPSRWGSKLGRFEPYGLFLVFGLAMMHWLNWLFEPAFRLIGRVFQAIVGSAA